MAQMFLTINIHDAAEAALLLIIGFLLGFIWHNGVTNCRLRKMGLFRKYHGLDEEEPKQ